ncbi:hypothetical protein COM89_26935 [Bacillus thuringiensis]|uniref:hypothetical protein n=1 Tax=Bacillus thuringiensis TaxID=1428 RepID=UPI000BEBDFF3|nr:hypothetical protein [Bacillus thuringiensis]PEB72617.1 hypothetical protein COM89_26935 [Bacillus thuringiensis]
MSAVEALNIWFNRLSSSEKEDVLEYLYEGILIKKENYIGPSKDIILEGLFSGPAPAVSVKTEVCPKCGKSY